MQEEPQDLQAHNILDRRENGEIMVDEAQKEAINIQRIGNEVVSPRMRKPELRKGTSKLNLLIEKMESATNESPRLEKRKPELTRGPSKINLLVEKMEACSASPDLSVLSPRTEKKRPELTKSSSKINLLIDKAESSTSATPDLSALSPRMEKKRPELTKSSSKINLLIEKAETSSSTPDLSVLSPRTTETKRPELTKSTSKINLLIEKVESSFAPSDVPLEKKRPELSKGTSKLNLLSVFEKGTEIQEPPISERKRLELSNGPSRLNLLSGLDEETTESPRAERKRPELSRVTSKINLLVEAGKQKSMSKLPIPLKNHKPAFIESLAPNLQESLREWLPDKQFNLLYQATRDGFEEDQFHLLCDNQGPSLSIVQSPDGFLFGGYNPENWESPDKPLYKTNPSTFIFTLTNPHSLPPTKYTFLHSDSNAHSTKNSKRHGPSFGEQVFWSGDLQISSSDHSGYVNVNFPVSFVDSTGKGDNTFVGSSRSPIQDLLVYSVK
eukprot:Phypoly_transcript_06004.p1 GENE.Phypoly_transcript_06004~~Phypoly_transcript_06004.p1  ORF type:complete len:499 (+),score=82.48 Phypoly_transcript_06004:119-1615(+)